MLKLLSIACALGLVAGILDPICDHHFAERDPFHSHLSLGPATNHIELYQIPGHHHAHQHQTEDQHPVSSAPVAVKNLDALGSNGPATVTVPTIMEESNKPWLADLFFVKKMPELITIPLSLEPSPPDKPPKATL